MVNEIYSDFIRIVSKERKIETKILEEDIGALIFTSDQASALNLIDDELNLEELVNKIINDNNLKDYRVIKSRNTNNSLLRQILSSNLNKKNHNLNFVRYQYPEGKTNINLFYKKANAIATIQKINNYIIPLRRACIKVTDNDLSKSSTSKNLRVRV